MIVPKTIKLSSEYMVSVDDFSNTTALLEKQKGYEITITSVKIQ